MAYFVRIRMRVSKKRTTMLRTLGSLKGIDFPWRGGGGGWWFTHLDFSLFSRLNFHDSDTVKKCAFCTVTGNS